MAVDIRPRVAALCAQMPGAVLSDPWGGGHDVWKIGGKMFATIGTGYGTVRVKCADFETASLLIDAGVASRAEHMHRSWVALPASTGDEELEHRIATSYALIRAVLPAATRRALEAL
jgi:predicted DNA-binding protein (MmcQ/YjbR family)